MDQPQEYIPEKASKNFIILHSRTGKFILELVIFKEDIVTLLSEVCCVYLFSGFLEKCIILSENDRAPPIYSSLISKEQVKVIIMRIQPIAV